MRRLLVFLLMAVLVLVPGSGALAGQRPETTTIHLRETETFLDVGCEQVVPITIRFRGVIHETLFRDGRVHVTGTFTGTFTFSEAGVDYAGHFTSWFGLNVNRRNWNATDTFTAVGRGSDGAHIRFQVVAHVSSNAKGDVVVEFVRVRGHC
ncbi:MAG: hypothetical protein M3524_10080 [Actinomycetota bacterium]|nr:hypothetical protein [Actinomycetota bacterium]